MPLSVVAGRRYFPSLLHAAVVVIAIAYAMSLCSAQTSSAGAADSDREAAHSSPAHSDSARSDPKSSLSGPPGAERPHVLQQMDTAIEELTSRISPAVVQILVTGYGVLEESSHGQTALVAREHAIGSGVIVDSNGYIITNAHVVEGAQRIHVALWFPWTILPTNSRRPGNSTWSMPG